MGVTLQRAWSSLACGVLVTIAVSACGTRPAMPVLPKHDQTPANSEIVQSLQRQIKERDKYIAELESRLEVMKVIDQDIEKRRNFNRPPAATLVPADKPLP